MSELLRLRTAPSKLKFTDNSTVHIRQYIVRILPKVWKYMEKQELKFEQECRLLARRNGWVCCKLEKNGCKGIPDDLFISPDERYLLIEFKKDEHQKPRPEQRVWLQRLPKTAHLVCSFAEFCHVTGLTEMPKEYRQT